MNSQTQSPAASADSLKSWLIAWLAGELAVDQEAIDPGQAFLSYGLDSVQAMSLVGDLEVKLGRRLRPTLVWDYPNINALAHHLADLAGEAPAASRAEVESLLANIDRISDQEVESLLARYHAKP